MSDYVEQGYSNGYVEGDNTSSTKKENESTNNNSSVNCDLTVLLEKMQEIAFQNEALRQEITSQNIELKKEISFLKDEVATIAKKVISNNMLNLEIHSKLIKMKGRIDNLATTDYIDNKVPFVDDINLEVFKKGTIVVTSISGGFHTVESSSFLPDGQGGYSVVYTLSKEIDGVKRFSQFHSSYVSLGYPEEFFRKSDFPEFFPIKDE